MLTSDVGEGETERRPVGRGLATTASWMKPAGLGPSVGLTEEPKASGLGKEERLSLPWRYMELGCSRFPKAELGCYRRRNELGLTAAAPPVTSEDESGVFSSSSARACQAGLRTGFAKRC